MAHFYDRNETVIDMVAICPQLGNCDLTPNSLCMTKYPQFTKTLGCVA
jgi:hypothetical protein